VARSSSGPLLSLIYMRAGALAPAEPEGARTRRNRLETRRRFAGQQLPPGLRLFSLSLSLVSRPSPGPATPTRVRSFAFARSRVHSATRATYASFSRLPLSPPPLVSYSLVSYSLASLSHFLCRGSRHPPTLFFFFFPRRYTRAEARLLISLGLVAALIKGSLADPPRRNSSGRPSPSWFLSSSSDIPPRTPLPPTLEAAELREGCDREARGFHRGPDQTFIRE
jgi:hypothetical protein